MIEHDFNQMWQRIAELAGHDFELKRGGSFTYEVHGKVLLTSRTAYNLSRSTFEQAWLRMPLEGPGEIQDLRGPSYVWAILTDPRVNR